MLSAFRSRLVNEQVENLLLDRLLEVCKQQGWLKAGGKQRTDSTHVLARVRSLSNLECVGETLRAALDDLATLAPDWLVTQISPDWFERYSHRVENYRLPKQESQRTALAQQIGADGLHLLQALESSDAPAGLKDQASVQLLRQVWQQYYDLSEGQAKWRAGPQASEGEGIIRSPYDPEAQTGKKREMTWLGYKAHLTETCVAQQATMPQLIVQVQTTLANVQDVEVSDSIQEDLAQHDLLPEDQVVDTGYVDADLLESLQEKYGIRLLGPALSDNSWQAKAGKGFAVAHFQLDWPSQQATCPQGHQSSRWSRAGDRIEVVFAQEVCAGCPVLHLRPQATHSALQARRHEQQTPEFRQRYASRAGIEGTLSQGVRGMGLRRASYDGLHKTHLQHVLIATAINLVRIDAVCVAHHIARNKANSSRLSRSKPSIKLASRSQPRLLLS